MFVYYFVAWLIWGIDPTSRAIMPDWEPPADLSPLECAYIDNNGKAPKNSFFIHILYPPFYHYKQRPCQVAHPDVKFCLHT